jgi:hypothetical protein
MWEGLTNKRRSHYCLFQFIIPCSNGSLYDLAFPRQLPVKLTVKVTEECSARRADFRFFPQSTHYILLQGDTHNNFHLEIALGGFGIIFFLHAANDVAWVGVVETP